MSAVAPASIPDIKTLDALPPEAFAAAVAPLFEGAPRFLARLAAARPFGSVERLFARAREIARSMPHADQVELLDAHPRLGAPPGSVSALSFHEQGYDREDAAGAAEAERARIAAELERLNEAYETQFGFRFCTFVADRPRTALLVELQESLRRRQEAERERAIVAVVDIAMDRHAKLVAKETA